MKKIVRAYFLIAASFCSLEAGDKTKMLQDLDVIKSVFETKYAPFEWKRSYFGWNLEDQIKFAKIQILTFDSLTVKDYQRILHAFFISTCDYHVSAKYYSTESAQLPFIIKKLSGKYLITDTEKDIFKGMQIEGLYTGTELPQIGSELIIFDSEPVEDIIEELKHYEIGNPSSKTSQVLSERVLTKRLGAAGHFVPSGPIEISFKNSNGEIIDATVTWLYRPEKIKNHSYYSLLAPLSHGIFEEETLDFNSRYFSPLMINSSAEMLQKNDLHHFDYLKGDNKVIADDIPDVDIPEDEIPEGDISEDIPEVDPIYEQIVPVNRNSIVLGKKLWSETHKTDFKAHIYELPETNKRIGYIRLSTFSHDCELSGYTHLALRLAKSINYLQTRTDALVVDQVDNPGGLGFYALAIASMLTDRPLELPQNHFAITQHEVMRACQYLDALKESENIFEDSPQIRADSRFFKSSQSYIAGFPIDSKFIEGQLNFNQFIIDQWDSAKTFTDPFPLMGIDYLFPHPKASYTKPILILVNSNDFSCADFFPAIMQDNKRAVIFGEQTAGAGGAVEKFSYPNSFGLAGFTVTTSLSERISGKMIENLGVTPDVHYVETEDDVLRGYKGYIDAVNNTLQSMLNKSKTKPKRVRK